LEAVVAQGVYILSENERRTFARIVAKAWSGSEFAQRYSDEPYAVLIEHGIDYPTNVPPPMLPPRPVGDFSVEQLEAVVAGVESTAYCFPCSTATATQACPQQ
jgi:putative thiazole/oxazole-modified microcin (TOMM)-like peptide